MVIILLGIKIPEKLMSFLFVALGGAVGAMARYAISVTCCILGILCGKKPATVVMLKCFYSALL